VTAVPSTTEITDTVHRYLDAVASGTAEDIAALYADDATLEDPVGSEPRSGRAAIGEFYGALDGTTRKTQLHTVRVAGDSAAFSFTVTTDTGQQTVEIGVIDVMTFDDRARITSMRAFWGSDDVTVLP
jgi:steroid Delta-isomerase